MCSVSFAQTETLNWYIDGNVYTTTQCESGNDILLPTTPTKRGYTFKGWARYVPIEYLESTGTQYIDTGTTVSTDYTFVIKMAWTRIEEVTTFFGSKENQIWTNGRYLGVTYYSNNKTFYSRARTETAFGVEPTLFSPIVNIVNNILFKPSSCKFAFNNVEYVCGGISQTADVFTTANNLYIFATNQAGTAAQFDYVRLYNFRIYNSSNILVRDFIPVLDGNGTPCMYDKVERKFYYNAGTGQFIAGPVIGE